MECGAREGGRGQTRERRPLRCLHEAAGGARLQTNMDAIAFTPLIFSFGGGGIFTEPQRVQAEPTITAFC